jgi:hypothetical protein
MPSRDMLKREPYGVHPFLQQSLAGLAVFVYIAH